MFLLCLAEKDHCLLGSPVYLQSCCHQVQGRGRQIRGLSRSGQVLQSYPITLFQGMPYPVPPIIRPPPFVIGGCLWRWANRATRQHRSEES
jgi:hypothetical protein